MKRLFRVGTLGVLLVGAPAATAVGPIPIGEADVSLSYMTDSGLRVLSSSVDYSGKSSNDAIPLGGDARVGYFNSVNSFGRRPLIDGAIRDDESLLTHSIFKPPAHDTNLFPDIVAGSSITLEVQNIHLTEPGFVQRDTVLMHKIWDADQVDQLPNFYINLNDHDTGTDPFRDFADFFPLVFTDFPVPNYDLAALSGPSELEVFGDGTDTLGFRITVPYDRFRNFEDVTQQVPPGLPAPFGFLEPFHFHVEFAVSSVPEPGAALMLLAGCPYVLRRKRK